MTGWNFRILERSLPIARWPSVWAFDYFGEKLEFPSA